MEPKQSGFVQSIDRAIDLMECIVRHPGGIRLSDLAREVELPVSTVHRLLITLDRRKFVQADSATNMWVIGDRANSVGNAYGHHENLIIPARPVMKRLRDLTHETANLGYILDGETITLAQTESREIMRAISPPGGRVPILNSGMGKAIVAHWPSDAIDHLITTHGLRTMTKKSMLTREEVFDDIRRIRKRGYALDDEEFVIGMRCVAAPVWSKSGEPISSLSVSGLAARVTHENIEDVAKHVMAAAKELTDLIGGYPS